MSHSCLNCGKRYDTQEKLKRHEKSCDRDISSTPSRSVSRSVSSEDKSNQLIRLIDSERNRPTESSSNPNQPSDARLKVLEKEVYTLKSDVKKHYEKFDFLAKIIDEKLIQLRVPKVESEQLSTTDKTYEDVECKILKRTIESQKTSFLRNLNSMQTQVDHYKKQMDEMENYNSKLHSDFELLVDGYNKKIVELEKDIQVHYIEEYRKNIKEYKEKSELCDLLKQKLEEMETDKKSIFEKERNASRLKDECLAKLNEMNKKTADIVKERNDYFQKCTSFEIRIKDLDSREKLLATSNSTIESMKSELENKQKMIDELMSRNK